MSLFLQRFQLSGIRNLTPCDLNLDQQLSIFVGDNGAGKSSILEAIGLLTTGRSFRTSKYEHVLQDECEQFTLFSQANQGLQLGLGFIKPDKRKIIKVNGEVQKTLSGLSKRIPTQIISPESYHLIDSGPGERRKFLDWCLFHVEHSYHERWKSFTLLLKQRNALLKQFEENTQSRTQLDIWDKQFVEVANVVTQMRQQILSKIEHILNQLLVGLEVDFRGKVRLNYYPGYTNELSERLAQNIGNDFQRGLTSAGPHKADIRIKIDNHLARDYLSRGQKKLLINTLYLAQTLLLKQYTKKGSIFIIDDFSSELDRFNQKALLETLLAQDNVQIILSCLELDSLKWLKTRYNTAQMFHVEHGEIKPIDRLFEDVETTELNQ